MNILLTGAAGYVGKALLESTYFHDYDITGIDCVDSTNIVNADIRRPLEIDMHGQFGVIHLAGISRVKKGEIDPRSTFEINVQGSANVLDYALKNSADWVILGGTIESSNSAYGLSKRFMSSIGEYYASRGLKVGVLNFASIYGGIGGDGDKLINILFERALKNEVITLLNPSDSIDFVHVEDVISGLVTFMDQLHASEERFLKFDLGLGDGISKIELAKEIVRITGSNSHVACIEDENPGGQAVARNLLRAWNAKFDLHTGLKRALESLRLATSGDM